MQNWLVGACALLTAGSAHAQAGSAVPTKVGEWEVVAEPEHRLCKMYRYYGSSADDHVEGVTVRYHAKEGVVGLTWSTDGATLFPGDGQIDLHLGFTNGKSINDSWGSRTFRHAKPDDTRYFVHQFASKDAQRILRDLGSSGIIGLYLGPVLLTALYLNASDATQKLRECAVQVAGTTPVAPPPE